jgi:hypothetical protein
MHIPHKNPKIAVRRFNKCAGELLLLFFSLIVYVQGFWLLFTSC